MLVCLKHRKSKQAMKQDINEQANEVKGKGRGEEGRGEQCMKECTNTRVRRLSSKLQIRAD